ncbi:unnamed protein product (macronuclear) [Paramecium tetraurelia]|uniref:Uncharacterized protein n=1 Tax=Paramecium tetraurelia TaxID=5888 RepID=A0DTQ8_PARTE|nr:uncharacterized protein GSPATT00020107001 [Paramecium tetraurelia]CAK86425.1 unnamed protein product [Paramecium tetraurelia]|eukprot:XP_001453822.1 hypothetical protein (macronuclear) [Paramecium tetraurelia strain d4-2]
MLNRKQLTIQLGFRSRQTSPSSQGSATPKHKKSNSYLQYSPKLDCNNGLQFVNEIKELKIISPRTEDLYSPKSKPLQQKNTVKDEQMKKSQFSKTKNEDFI